MHVRALNAIAAAALFLGAAATGQESRPTPTPPADEPRSFETFEYRAALSWALFRAGDLDSNDELSLFEVVALFPAVELPLSDAARAVYRRLDPGRDGLVDFGEFDAFYLERQRTGRPLELVLRRPLLEPDDPSAPARASDDGSGSATARLRRWVDIDGDGLVSLTEIVRLASTLGVATDPAQIAAALDANRSGQVEIEEAMQLVDQPQVRDLLLPRILDTARKSTLQPEYRAADVDGNGVLDAFELNGAMRLLGPGLGRVAATVIEHADRNRSATLGVTELVPRATAVPMPEPTEPADDDSARTRGR